MDVSGGSKYLRDADVRPGLRHAVTLMMGEELHLLVPEVEIRWSIPARMDAFLVGPCLSGFEIKSDVDSLARLPRQVEAYSQVVECGFLVVGERHRTKATALVPEWWHVWAATRQDDEVIVHEIRGGGRNPEINALAVASFLPRQRLVVELGQLGEKRLSARTVDDLRLMLVERLGNAATLATVRAFLLSRPD